MPWVPGAHKGEKNYRVPRSSLLLARSLSGIAVSGERFDLVRELSDSLSSGFFRLSWQVV